jgi:competence protein ComEA
MNSLKTLLCSFLLVGFVGFANAAVDINTADQATLQTIKGIGPAKAEEIIKYRTEKGPFKSVDDLKNVKGIGAKVLEAIKNDVTVGGGAVPKPEEKKPAEAKPADKAPAKAEEKKPAEAKPADKAPAKVEEKKPVTPTPNKM